MNDIVKLRNKNTGEIVTLRRKSNDIVKLRNKNTGEIVTLRRKSADEKPKNIFQKKPDIYTALGADLPKEATGVEAGLYEATRGALGTPALHFLNMAGANLPREMARERGIEYPEGRNLAENIAAKLAGIGGAFFMPIGWASRGAKFLTTQVPRQIAKVVGKPAVTSMARFISRPGVAREALQGSITGGLASASFAPEGDPWNIAKRAASIPLGASIGAVAQPALYGVSKLVDLASRFKKPTYVEKASGEKGVPFKDLTVDERIANRQARAEQKASEKISRRTDYGKEVSKELQDAKYKTQDLLNNAEKELYSISQKGGILYKQKLNKFSNDFSEAYGQSVDDMADKLIQSNQKIMRSQADDIITNTITELTEEGLPTTNRIKSLQNKYSLEKTSAEGEKIIQQDSEIPLREFLSDMKSLTKRTSEQVFKGAKARSEEQLSDSILKNKFGDFLSTMADDFKPLQKQASEILNSIKLLRRGIQPKDVGATKTSTKFVQDFAKSQAKGKVDIGTKKAINKLEKGTKLLGKPIEGAGKISSSPIQMAKKMASIETSIKNKEKLTAERLSQINNDIANIETALKSRKNEIERGFAGKQRYAVLKRRLQIIKNVVGYSLIGAGTKFAYPRTVGRLIKQQ